MTDRYRLYGGMGSPYSKKMRAVLRYRRLPFDWVIATRADRERLDVQGPAIIPILQFPDGHCAVDSTPLILELEAHASERSIVPADPVHAFLAMLLEDLADEWFTKMMFHYRWAREEDQRWASEQIVSDNSVGVTGRAFADAVEAIRARQVSRMPLVGCTPENAPLIEAGFREVLTTLSGVAVRDQFLFGTRPSLADFAIFGQLHTLCEDHTPHHLVRAEFPRVYDWIRRLDDLSGLEGDWSREMTPTALALLRFAGRVYLPFLVANAEALAEGSSSVELEIDGLPYTQAPFRYQGKCWRELQRRHDVLEADVRAVVDDVLADTGCLAWFGDADGSSA